MELEDHNLSSEKALLRAIEASVGCLRSPLSSSVQDQFIVGAQFHVVERLTAHVADVTHDSSTPSFATDKQS